MPDELRSAVEREIADLRAEVRDKQAKLELNAIESGNEIGVLRRQRDDLRAEVERLKQQHQEYDERNIGIIDRLRAEVERERKRIAECIEAWEGTIAKLELQLSQKSAEVGRLTRERDEALRDLQYQTDARLQDARDSTTGFQRWKLEHHDPLHQSHAALVAALERLTTEFRWLPELGRACIGNTNVAVLELRLSEARAALDAARQEVKP